MLLLGVISSSLQKAYRIITEGFNRADSTSLGNAPGGQVWTTVSGSWGISNNKASSATPTGFPQDINVASLKFTSTDVSISVDGIGPGCGTAFWITDSGNWWGSYINSEAICSTCSSGGNCAGYYEYCSSSYYAPAYYYYYVYYEENGPGNTAPCSNCGIYTYCGTNCKRISIKEYSPASYTCNANATACGSYNPVYTYSCNCYTERSVNIFKRADGNIVALAKKIVNGPILGIKTILSGNTITVKAYTGLGYTNETNSGETTYTDSGPLKTKNHGILVTKALESQATTIDEFKVE